METFVEFRSAKFPPYEDEEELINPGLWGKRLAEYLVARLPEQGVEPAEIIPEDWGWYIPINDDKRTLGICCGHQSGDEDEFLCFTDPQAPMVKKLFKTIDVSAELTRLTDALRQILANDPDIVDVVWREP